MRPPDEWSPGATPVCEGELKCSTRDPEDWGIVTNLSSSDLLAWACEYGYFSTPAHSIQHSLDVDHVLVRGQWWKLGAHHMLVTDYSAPTFTRRGIGGLFQPPCQVPNAAAECP